MKLLENVEAVCFRAVYPSCHLTKSIKALKKELIRINQCYLLYGAKI